MKHYIFIEIFGWIGIILIISAFALVSHEIISPASATYVLLNGVGSLGVLIVSYVKRVWQPVILNVFWLIISGTALVRLFT